MFRAWIIRIVVIFTLLFSSLDSPRSNVQAGASAADTPFSFVTLSDAQDGGSALPKTASQALALNPDFGIFVGDLESDGVTQSMMNVETTALGSLYPKMLLVRGNHDDHVSGSANLWENYFVAAKRSLPAGVTNLTALNASSTYLNYSFDYGNSRFIGLDVPGDVDLLTTTQLNFLDARLTDAETNGLVHAFIFFHGPPYCAESTHCRCKAKNDGSCTPSALITVINKHPIVHATFDGHEHLLAWTHMDNTRVPSLAHPYEQFLTAPSGSETYNPYLYPNRVDYANLQEAKAFGSVTVDGASFTVNFYRVGTTAPVWSKTFSGAAPTVPSAPSLTSPANNAVTSDYTPLFDWSDSSVPAGVTFDHYQLQVAVNDPNFAAPAMDANITGVTNSNYTPPADLASNTHFYWRVRAWNSTGGYSAWSSVFSFRTTILPTTLSLPANGSTNTSLRPVFDWANVAGAASYNIQVSISSAFASTVINQNVTASTYTPASNLAPNQPYYWRVMTKTALVSSIWSEVFAFTTGNPPPGVPVLTALTMQPANGILVTSLTPTFAWGAPTPPAAYFHLQVSLSNQFTTTAIDQTQIPPSPFTPASALAPGQRYFWRVQGVNTAGVAGAWTAAHYFQTPLSTPVLISPTEAEALFTDRPTFDWQDTPGAAQYTIQIAPDNKFSKLLVSQTVPVSTFTPASDLPQNKLLFWRVVAKTKYVTSPWSAASSFTSGNPPTVPSLLKPSNKSRTSDYTPFFDWSNSRVPTGVTFDHYQLQVAANDPKFASSVIDVNITDNLKSTFTPTTDLASNTLYYWRVRSWSTAQHYSGWSSVFSFRTTILPTTLSAPLNGSTDVTPRPTFDWADVPGAASYVIQVSSLSTFKSSILMRTVTASTFTPTSDLPLNKKLYWRVMTKTAFVSSIWSTVFSFTCGTPPGVPSLISPANTATTSDATPLFDWSNSSVPSGVTFDHYQLQVAANDPTFTAPAIDASITGVLNSTYTPSSDLASSTLFYWRVRGSSAAGLSSAWSSVFTFTTTVPGVGSRPLKYYMADRVIHYADFSKLAGWGINTAMVDFDVNGSPADWKSAFTEAAKYGISVVIWPSDWNNPRPNCNWEAPFPVSANGDITKIKPLLDVASTFPNFIGVINGHESFWSCTNMTFNEMAGLKTQLKAYALSKGRAIKVWNYINSLYDTSMLPDNQISRIMDVAVTWKHCAGGVEGPCDTGRNSALAQINSDRARITNAGLDGQVELVYIIQTFTYSGGYNVKFTLPQLENYSCEFINTQGLDGFGFYTWEAGWWPDLHSWPELQPAIAYVHTPGNCH